MSESQTVPVHQPTIRRKTSAQTAIVGAGISGLVAAWTLERQGHEVHVFEASDRPGGKIQTQTHEGWTWECGPNTLLYQEPEMVRLLHDLGLEPELQFADPRASKRFIVHRGQLRALPTGPLNFLGSPLLSLRAKIRLLREPWIRRYAGMHEETLANFVRRRLGREVLEYLVNPFVAGIYAGDPETLSLQYAFPLLHQFEQTHGSLMRGGMKYRPEQEPQTRARKGSKVFTLRGGVQRLTETLAARLGDHLQLNMPIEQIAYQSGQWRLKTPYGFEAFDRLLLAADLPSLQRIQFADHLERSLGNIPHLPHPPVYIWVMGFRREAVQHPLDGFGFLVPRQENLHILGTLFNSTAFPDRVPPGHVMLSTFVGGTRQPHLTRLPVDEQRALVLRELDTLLGIRGEPVFERCVAWPEAIPQYELGYGHFLQTLEQIESDWTGIHFLGNYRGGISVPNTIRNAVQIAHRVLDS